MRNLRTRCYLKRKTAAAAVAVVAWTSPSSACAFQPTSLRNHCYQGCTFALSVATDPMTYLEQDMTTRREKSPRAVGTIDNFTMKVQKRVGSSPSSVRLGSSSERLLFDESVNPSFSGITNSNARNQRKTPGSNQAVTTSLVSPVKMTSQISAAVKSLNSKSNRETGLSSSPKPKSRSSTMPGYAAPSKNQISRMKRMNQIQDVSLKNLGKSALAEKSAAKKSGEAMYQASDSVPDSLMQFARELHQENRITPSEELELGRLTQEAIQLQSTYDQLVETLQREPTDDEWCAASGKINMEAIRQAMDEGMEAKNKLVTANLRMVQGVVNVYIRNGLSGQYNAGDLMQDGVMALIRAAEKFEPQRGFRFSTYAMYWIRSAVKRSQLFQSRVITIPQRLHANHKRVKITQRQLQQALGRPPSQIELADSLGMSLSQLDRCLKSMEQRCFSLDQQLNNRNNLSGSQREDTMYDVVECKAKDGDDNSKISRVFLRDDLIESLYRTLDREAAHIIMLRYGLVDDPSILPIGFEGPLTIAQVSELVGMKPDKVRRKIIKALKELKFSIGDEWRDFEQVVE